MNAPFATSGFPATVQRVVRGSLALDLEHARRKVAVVGASIRAEVHAPMAVRAYRDHMSRVVWAAITDASNVMRFQIERSVQSSERPFLAAAFTGTCSASQDVRADISAPPDHASQRIAAGRLIRGSCERAPSKLFERNRSISRAVSISLPHEFVKATKQEDEDYAVGTVPVLTLLLLDASADPFAFVTERAAPELCEKQQVFADARVVCDRGVAPGQRLVADLTFTRVLEHPIIAPSVDVTMVLADFTGHQNHHRCLLRRDDAALLLAAVNGVNVSAPVVCLPAVKRPRLHGSARRSRAPLNARRRTRDRNRDRFAIRTVGLPPGVKIVVDWSPLPSLTRSAFLFQVAE